MGGPGSGPWSKRRRAKALLQGWPAPPEERLKARLNAGPKRGWTVRRKRFVSEFVKHGNGTQAAKTAGYKAADTAARDLLRHPEIVEEIDKRLARVAEKAEVDAVYIRKQLKLNAEIALGVVEAPTGETVYEGNVANRALELLGKDKAISMFEDKITVKAEMAPEDRLARISALLEVARQRALTDGNGSEGDEDGHFLPYEEE